MAYDVFISHSTRDKAVADAVCAGLENGGIRCWIAPRDVQPGRSFAGEIARAIKNSKAMVLIFSAHSNNSEQVLREVQLSVTAHLHIVQFRIEDVHLNDDLSYFLSTPHWLDALTPPLENHIERLKTSIRALLGTPVEPSVIPAAAPEFQTATRPRRVWQSVAAVILGFSVHIVGIYGILWISRAIAEPISIFPAFAGMLCCAVAAGYTVARFAPRNPTRHVWALGFIWLVLAIGKGIFSGTTNGITLVQFFVVAVGILTWLLCLWLGGVLHRKCHGGSPHSSSEERGAPANVPPREEVSMAGTALRPPVNRVRKFMFAGAIVSLLTAGGLGGWWFGLEQPRKNAERQRQLTEQAYVNSLGMKFVPVPKTNVLFSIWETRVKDHKVFAEATRRDWPKPVFQQTEEHPAVNVSWEDATAFCEWLTKEERKTGRISAVQSYRLPTDLEWSAAVGLEEESGGTPYERTLKVRGVYPWGSKWPPPNRAGNYGSSLKVDDYEQTSPVGSFASNVHGIYDLGGNVREWCEDWLNGEKVDRVLRGSSWFYVNYGDLLSSCRASDRSDFLGEDIGFRCVLVVESSR